MPSLEALLPMLLGSWSEYSNNPRPTGLFEGDLQRGLTERLWQKEVRLVKQSCRIVFFRDRPLWAAWGRVSAPSAPPLCCEFNTVFIQGHALPPRRGIPLLFRFTHPQAGEGFGVVSSLSALSGQMHATTYADLAVRGDWVALEPVIRWRDHLLKPVMHAAYGRAANR
jgi:hypothetical protein